VNERRIERFTEIVEGVLHRGQFSEFLHPRAAGGKFRVTTGGQVLNGYHHIGSVQQAGDRYHAHSISGEHIGSYPSKEKAGRRVLTYHLGDVEPDPADKGRGEPYPSAREKNAGGMGYGPPPGTVIRKLKTPRSGGRSTVGNFD
jgi:hypothetical protein